MRLPHVFLIGAMCTLLGLILAAAMVTLWQRGFGLYGVSVGVGLAGMGVFLLNASVYDIEQRKGAAVDVPDSAVKWNRRDD